MRAVKDSESREFQALLAGEIQVALVATEFDGEETTCIAEIRVDGDHVEIVPLYVSVTHAMFDRMKDPGKDLPEEVRD